MSETPEPPALPDERPQRRREYTGAGSTLGVAALIVLAVGLGIWWFELRGDGGGGGNNAGLGVVALPEELNPTGAAPAAQAGRAAPDFRLATLDGQTAALTDFRGRYVLVNFWASWCGPCRGETPDLQRMHERLAGTGRLAILGVNQQEPRAAAKEFADRFDVEYPILLDTTGEVSVAYRVGVGLPVTFLIDPDGVIVRVYIGRIAQADLDAIEAEYLS